MRVSSQTATPRFTPSPARAPLPPIALPPSFAPAASPAALPLQAAAPPSTGFLDGMRGLAAFYVLMRHVTWMPAPAASGHAWHRILSLLEHTFRYGHTAVVFFFVLSGFVIHLRYAKQLQADAAAATFRWGDFVFRRARRLYPPLFAAILITSLFDRFTGSLGLTAYYTQVAPGLSFLHPAILFNHEFSTLLGNLLFLTQMHVPVWGSDNPLWSLTYEWWFYMLYPILWHATRRSILLASGIVLGGFLLTRLGGSWPSIQDRFMPFEGWHMLLLPSRIFGALPAWWCGVLLADVYAGRIQISFKKLAWLTLILGCMFIKDLPEVLKALTAAIGFTGLIALGFHLQQRNVKFKLLNQLKFLGDFSYSLYVTHWPIVIFLTPLWASRVGTRFPGAPALGILVIALIPLIIAYAVHLIAEAPFTRNAKPKPDR